MYGYNSRPWHLIFPLMLSALGCVALLSDDWYIFSGFCFVFSFASFLWIVIAGLWAERARYYESVADAINASSKVDLDKLAALGLKSDDQLSDKLHIDLYEGHQSRHFDLPVSHVKLRPLAVALLDGQPFSEKRWVIDGKLLSSSEFRSLRAMMKSKGLIQPVSEKDNRQGFALTDAGRQVLRGICSPTPPPGERIEI